MTVIRSAAVSLALPAVLMIAVWLAVIAALAIGPIEYPGQPSYPALLMIGVGIALFLVGNVIGSRLSRFWPIDRDSSATRPRIMGTAIGVAAALGILGIALIALDRNVLSGVYASGYATFLRCAPEFIDYIEIPRTPLIYVGYMFFSFGFASLALYLLRAEEVEGWPSYLAQLSIVSPIGYALIYSGRMPILFMLTTIAAVGIIRLSEGRTLMPRGHHLVLKVLILIVAFVAYTNVTWSMRREFCASAEASVKAIREEIAAKKRTVDRAKKVTTISSERFVQILEETRTTAIAQQADRDQKQISTRSVASQFVSAVMQEAWAVRPRDYLLTFIERGLMSPETVISFASNCFYLTHGTMILDRIWRGREYLTPLWGIYEIGVLSPIIRVYAPQSDILLRMNRDLRDANIYGFFPTAWGAAFIDFGAVGGGVYLLIWGLMGGWAYSMRGRTTWATPPLLLSFVLGTILLSPVQGPLGIANSALVLVSVLVLGLAIDWAQARRNSSGA